MEKELYHADLYRIKNLDDVTMQEHPVFYAKDDKEAFDKIMKYAKGKGFWVQVLRRVTDDPFGKPIYFELRPNNHDKCQSKGENCY